MNPDTGDARGRPPIITIALLSGASLAYEVLLMRLFSIIQWHHFAYMIISLALLGYGVSGSVLALTQHRLLPRFRIVFPLSLALFALTIVPSFLIAQSIPFNPEALLWDPREPLRLLAIYLILSLPFFLAATAIALALAAHGRRIARLYAADLTGAGIGSLAVIMLLYAATPINVLAVIGVLGLCAVMAAAWELALMRKRRTVAAAFAAVLVLSGTGTMLDLNISPYKGLSQQLQIAGSRVVAERSGPQGLLTVIRNKQIPLRHAPGLSLHSEAVPPSQLGIFTDGDSMSPINRYDGQHEPRYLDQLTSALPYHLHAPGHVLVLGAGGGSDVLQARLHGARRIDAVELNPHIVELVSERFSRFSGGLYEGPNVEIHVAEARGFIEDNPDRYDLIQIALLDAFAGSAAGLHALNESYIYTTEALQAYYSHLEPGGYLSITRWVTLPPRDTLKLFATVVDALRGLGVEAPGSRMLLIRGWQTSTLLVKNGLVRQAELQRLRAFCEERGFDAAYFPGIEPDDANRYNKLRRPYFFEGAHALLSDRRDEFLKRYKFNLKPATDDRPYFFNFFRWSALPEILGLRGRGGMPLLEWGYLILIATLAQALLASALLILAPLWLRRRSDRSAFRSAGLSMRVFGYFGAIGLAFLFIEIAFIQKFILFLHHPLYAAAAVLTAFLVFAGAGSAWSSRLQADRSMPGVIVPVAAIVVCVLLYSALLGPLFSAMMPLALPLKLAASIVVIAPLAFFMGMPFPLAMGQLSRNAGELLPWAWGINGCASVVSAVLATLLAVHFGFTIVVLAAAVLYCIAAASFPAKG